MGQGKYILAKSIIIHLFTKLIISRWGILSLFYSLNLFILHKLKVTLK